MSLGVQVELLLFKLVLDLRQASSNIELHPSNEGHGVIVSLVRFPFPSSFRNRGPGRRLICLLLPCLHVLQFLGQFNLVLRVVDVGLRPLLDGLVLVQLTVPEGSTFCPRLAALGPSTFLGLWLVVQDLIQLFLDELVL